MRSLGCAALLLATLTVALWSQAAPAPAPLNWSADDSARVAFVTARGRAYRTAHVTVWAPADSLDAQWLPRFVDSLSASLAALESLIGGPYGWQRLGRRPVTYYLSPGRFVSHASGLGAVFISLSRVRQGGAPFLHEAVHELLAPPPPFSPDEYPDSLTQERAAAGFPLWLSEGLADYVAQATAAATGFREGDVFEIGGLARVDSVCVARLAASPRRAQILDKVGGQGFLEALFTTERAEVAPIYYACSQSFSKFLVERIGVRAVVALFPKVASGTWLTDVAAAAGKPLGAVRSDWLLAIGWSGDLRD